MSKPDGGPAFPSSHWNGVAEKCMPSGGMTLRDYFAIHAPIPDATIVDMHQKSDMQRNPHNDIGKPPIRTRGEVESYMRYQFADAMLAERAK